LEPVFLSHFFIPCFTDMPILLVRPAMRSHAVKPRQLPHDHSAS
jgi:hypothetical protein